MQTAINPFFRPAPAAGPAPLPSAIRSDPQRYALLPQAPQTASPVPRLTNLYHDPDPGLHGALPYPSTCPDRLIRDLLRFYGAATVYDPVSGSDTCRDVCRRLGVYCWSGHTHGGFDALGPCVHRDAFQLAWVHLPGGRQPSDAADPPGLWRCPTLEAFLGRYRLLIANCRNALVPGGRLAVLVGDGRDRRAGPVPLVAWTERLAFEAGLRQCAAGTLHFSHGLAAGDVVNVFEKPASGKVG